MNLSQTDKIEIQYPYGDNLEKILADTKRYQIQYLTEGLHGKLKRVIFENESREPSEEERGESLVEFETEDNSHNHPLDTAVKNILG